MPFILLDQLRAFILAKILAIDPLPILDFSPINCNLQTMIWKLPIFDYPDALL